MKLKNREKTDLIVIHCSATKPDQYIGAEEITQWHKERGWLACGYHFIIDRLGRLEIGRQEEAIGAGVKGYNNTSIHVCMVGGVAKNGKPSDNFTLEQYNTLRNTILLLRSRYPATEIKGHTELDPSKACPSFALDTFLNAIKVNAKPTAPTTKYLT